MKSVVEIGRILFGLPMVIFGVFHFVNTSQLKAIVPAIIPGDTFWVILTGAALISAGISILIKKQVQTTCYFLAVMLIGFVLLIHLPSALEGNTTAINAMLKDTALAGGSIILGYNYRSKN